ncbi:MAG: ROK family protein [Phycisphaeraceae bacterium]
MPEESGLTVGVDLGGTNIQAGLVSSDGKLIARDSTKTKADDGEDTVVKRLCKLVEKVVEAGDAKLKQVDAIGIGAPGAIDFENGVVVNAVNLRWRDFPLKKEIEDILERPVRIDNDVNVGAWGEYKAGAGQGFDNQFSMFIGTGIGGGLVLGGELFHGPGGTAGEIGQTILHAGGGVGRRTLEQWASRTAVADTILQLVRSNRPSMVTDLISGDYSKLRSKVLSQAYAAQDPLVREVLDQAARDIGYAAANVVTLLSLPCVVLGGGLVEAIEDAWIDKVRDAFNEVVFPHSLRDTQVRVSTLGDDAGVIGAALLAEEMVA